MPSLKDLRNRIASVKATRKITKAMQMVAAAKLRRAQEAALAARPYSDRMAAVLGNLSRGMEGRGLSGRIFWSSPRRSADCAAASTAPSSSLHASTPIG